MCDNILFKELVNLKDYEFSTRLDCILKFFKKSRNSFYDDIEKETENETAKISKRTYDSYFSKSEENKRKPKEATVKIMAKILNIDMWLLTPNADIFKENLDGFINLYSKPLNVKPEKVPDLLLLQEDPDELEAMYYANIYQHYKNRFFNSTDIDDKIRKGILCILNYYDEYEKNEALYINPQIYEIIDCFLQLNEKGREKIILYGKFIVENFQSKNDSEPLYDIVQLCKKYDVVVNGMVTDDTPSSTENGANNNKLGQINLTMLANNIEQKIKYNYNVVDFLDLLNDLATCGFSHLSIILICILFDNEKKNGKKVFPDDALESYLLINQLFVMDEEFQA